MASELHQLGMSVSSAVGDGAQSEFAAFCKLYADLPDLDQILLQGGQKVDFPKEPSLRYAITIGLSARATTEQSIRNSFGWLIESSSPEWCQLFIHCIHDQAVKRNHLGLLASLLASDKRISRFLKNLMTPDAS